jgi:hypothetical protein
MTRNRMVAVLGALALGSVEARAGQDPTHEKSSTLNNSFNRAKNAPRTPRENFEDLPGTTATPREQWSAGDERGAPAQARRRKATKRARSTRPPKAERKTPPAESAGGER